MMVGGPGICEKRGSFQTSTVRYQKAKNSPNPSSIRYGRGLLSHCPKRYAATSTRLVLSAPSAKPAVGTSVSPPSTSATANVDSGSFTPPSPRSDPHTPPPPPAPP